MTTIATNLDVMGGDGEPSGVLTKLEATRLEWLRFERWLLLARVLLVELVVGAALVMADWAWVLPTGARAVGLLGMAAVALGLIVRLRRPLDRAGSAARVEAHFPDLGQRLRTIVEYAQPAPNTAPASPGLLKALKRDTDRRVSQLDFRVLIPWAAFERRAVILFFATTVGLITLLISPELRTAALRMLLLPVQYTTLKVEPGDLTLTAGHELKLDATLSGRPVAAASWSYRTKVDAGHWITASLAPATTLGQRRQPLIGTLSATLKDCQTDLDYRVVAGELESPIYHVKVVHPLLLKNLEATITPPPYTRRPTAVVKEGNFRAIEGSQVRFAITLDHTATIAQLLLGSEADSSRRSIPLQINGTHLTGELPPIIKDTEYQIDAIDGEGMKLDDAQSYRITVQLDGKPTIRFIQPEEALAVTPTTEVPFQVEASDDFGVSQLAIRYKVGDGPEETLHTERLEKQPVSAQCLVTLYLEKHKLNFTDAITYYAYADDNCVPEPHRTQSELRFIDILPYKQEYQVVDGGGACNGSLLLEELIARQRVNLNRTFAQEREKSVVDAAARRLARFEQELAAATSEFAEGISALVGPIPALESAAAAMKTATELLTAKNLAGARPREEAALKNLISVRQNLRKLLSQSSSSQASAGRSFDVKQLQKIRRPPADETKKQLAKLETDLRALAKREEKFSEEIEAKGKGGPQFDTPKEPEKQAQSSQKPASKSSSSRPGASSQGQKSGQASGSNSRLADEQRQAAAEAERLRQLARRDEALTDLTNRRLDAAAQAVEQSALTAESGQTELAAREAQAAARKLESTARQVGALKARELSDRLARQRDLAQAIAKAERELAKALERQAAAGQAGADPDQRLTGNQGELADEVRALADVLDQTRKSAAEEEPELAQTIDQAAQANSPAEIEKAMRENAAAIGAGRTALAAREAERASERLDALALDLESARRATVQPQLDRLLAAEKMAAELQDRIRSVKQDSQQAEAEKSISDLARLIDNLAPGDGPLREAADHLTHTIQSSQTGWGRSDKVKPGESGYFVPPVAYSGSVSAVILALQAKIQEIVLDNALVERTGPVPSQYKSLVEDYYRVLSQDLR
jgi:hypothetical protein